VGAEQLPLAFKDQDLVANVRAASHWLASSSCRSQIKPKGRRECSRKVSRFDHRALAAGKVSLLVYGCIF